MVHVYSDDSYPPCCQTFEHLLIGCLYALAICPLPYSLNNVVSDVVIANVHGVSIKRVDYYIEILLSNTDALP